MWCNPSIADSLAIAQIILNSSNRQFWEGWSWRSAESPVDSRGLAPLRGPVGVDGKPDGKRR